MQIFRGERNGAEAGNPRKKGSTRRAPSNVPYIVDNLWEWKRPDGFPNRRYSVFASPSPELAMESAVKAEKCYRVEIQGDCRVAQIREPDAREHPDCRNLKRLLVSFLYEKGWMEEPLEKKLAIAALWAPCLSTEEVEEILSSAPLREIRDALWDGITIWDEVRIVDPSKGLPFSHGEVFFEADGGSSFLQNRKQRPLSRKKSRK